MKKFLILFISVSLFLAACGDNSGETNESTGSEGSAQEETVAVATQDEKETEEDGEDAVTMTSEENENKEAPVGDVVTNEAGESTLVSRTDDVGTFESGPIKMTIEKANGVSMKVSPDYQDAFGGEELEYIQVDMTVENTSDDHITFYASQAVMTTSTGEQIEPDMLMSDHLDGEYLGAVTKSGSSFYILENSKAEDVESIKLFYSAPVDEEDWEDVGEEIEVEVSLEK